MAITENAKNYWDARSELFANYYIKPSRFDRIFRKGVYTRAAVSMKIIQEFKNPTILDVGSGPGVNSLTWLKNSDAKLLVGIDFADNMVEFATNLIKNEGLEHRAKFIVGDMLDYDFKGEKFDISLAMGVFDYVQDAKKLLGIMKNISNKAVVSSWPRNGLRMMLRRYRYTCPLFHYTEKQVLDLHKELGFSNTKIMSTSDAGFTTVGYL